MAKGFGVKTHGFSATRDLLGIDVLLGYLEGECYVELRSVARMVYKSVEHLQSWMAKNDLQATSFLVEHNAKFIGLPIDSAISFFGDEAQDDNPYASQILSRGANYGMAKALDEAEAAGLDYINFPSGGTIRFKRVNGERVILMEDMAECLGVSPEDIQEKIESKEFQSWARHRWE